MRKAFIGFFIFIFLCFVAIYAFKDTIAKWYLEKQLAKAEELSEELSYGDLHVAFAGKQVKFTNIKYQSLEKDISFEVDELSFKGLSLYDLFQNNGLHVDSIFFTRPIISYDKTVQKNDSGKMNNIKLNIGYLNIEDGNLEIKIDSSNKVDFKNYEFTALSFNTTKTDMDHLFEYGPFKGATDTIIYENENNKMELANLSFSSDNKLDIGSLDIKNKNKNVRRTSELRAYINKTSMDVVMDSLIRNQVILSDLVTIDSFYIDSEVHQYDVSNTSVRPKMPIEMIRSLTPLKLVKHLTFKNGKIKYKEHQAKSDKVVSIFFKNMEGIVTGLGQESETNKTAKLKVRSDFMNVCHMKTDITFDLSSNYENHHIEGEVKPFDLEKLNVVLDQIAPFQFEGGAVNTFTFNFDLNDDNSSGVVNLLYNDLKISSYKKEDDSERGGVAIFLANTFVVRNNNPTNDDTAKGEVSFERIKDKSMFNYWWKSLFDGFKDVIVK